MDIPINGAVDELDPSPDRSEPYQGLDPDWYRKPDQLLRAVFRTTWWTFVPHDKNTATPKIVTSVLMLTWSAVTIGEAYGLASTGEFYPYMTVLVFSIVCAIWGFELGALNDVSKRAGVPIRQRRRPDLRDVHEDDEVKYEEE